MALKLEGNDTVVVETGLYNLTNDEVPVLVHFGPDRQEARTFIRLNSRRTRRRSRRRSSDGFGNRCCRDAMFCAPHSAVKRPHKGFVCNLVARACNKP